MLLVVSVRLKRLVEAPVAAFHVKVVVFAAMVKERFAVGAVKEDQAEEILAVVTVVNLPLASTVITGIAVPDP